MSGMKSTLLLLCALLACSSVSRSTASPSNGDLRFAGYGATSLWGRLEIYLKGKWGTICDRNFGIAEAEVACRQMGLGYSINYRASPYQRHGLANSVVHLLLDCDGSETHVLNCRQFRVSNATCNHLEDIEIICSDWKPWPYSGQIRLVGGITASEGLVEIYLHGEWGRVCTSSDEMAGEEANVICRQLGYDSAVSFTPKENDDQGSGGYLALNLTGPVITGSTIWYNDILNCLGNEVCLGSCLSSIPTSPVDQCSNEVGVRCTHTAFQNINVGSKSACEVNTTLRDKSLRLVGGAVPYIGRLEVFHNNEWGVMCFDRFFAAEGHVACRQLGYSVIYNYAYVTLNDTPVVHFYSVDCRGAEASFADCQFNEISSRQCVNGFTSIRCYNRPYPPLASVRMLGGSGPFGVIEIFNGGRWGPICDERFDQADGDVLCRQLGFTGALRVIPNSYLGVARNFLHMTNVHCIGNETHLWNCPFNNATEIDCNYYNQVAVHCGSNSSMLYGALRLTGGNSSMGRLEINIDGSWGTVCSRNFAAVDGHVACRQLGFTGVTNISNVTDAWMTTANHTIFLNEVHCKGYEDKLMDCRHKYGDNVCTYDEDVLLTCDIEQPSLDGKLRLVDGNTPNRGRLEVLKDGLWGTVCSSHFDMVDADVACRQMGFHYAVKVLENLGGGARTQSINIHDVRCIGNESRLIDCEHEVYTYFYCDHTEDVGIVCDALPSNGDLRFAGYGSTPLWGRVEIYLNGTWGTICDDAFRLKEADVMCRQMGQGYAINYRSFPLQRHGLANSTVHFLLSCNGSETHILNCQQSKIINGSCTHENDIEIICSDWKQQPYSGQLRLTGGTTVSEGFVEIYLNGEWGRVCSDRMSGDEANVICRQLGYNSAVSYTPRDKEINESGYDTLRISVGQAATKVWFNNTLKCTGNEVCLTSCWPSVPTSPADQCSNEVGVRCTHNAFQSVNVGNKSVCEVNSKMPEKSVRLVNFNAEHRGVLEVLYNGEWGAICFDYFYAAEGHVACRDLGYSGIYDYVYVTLNLSSTLHFYQVDCRGTEHSFQECDFVEQTNQTCITRQFVGIQCTDVSYPPLGSLRMLGGSGPFGVVEIFNGARWGPICDVEFDQEDGEVVCRQLGYTGIIRTVHNSYLGVARNSFQMTHLACDGDENYLWDCAFDNITDYHCDYYNQIAVYCGSNSSMMYGALRLTGGNSSSGRLEINLDDDWGSVCAYNFDMIDGHVACRQLGFKGVNSISVNSSWVGRANHTVFLTSVRCQGYEDQLILCRHDFGNNTCTRNQDVLLYCDTGVPEVDGQVRLVDKFSPTGGRLEFLKDGLWGTICSYHFGYRDARVACRQLGYTDYAQILRNYGGGRDKPINVHEINCFGYENSLVDCDRHVYTHFYCDYTENVAIVCDVPIFTIGTAANGDIRLAGDGSTSMVGRLEMFWAGEWGTVCGRKFRIAEAHVACRQLGLGYAASYSFNQRHGWSSSSVKLEVTSCVGNESHLFDCKYHLNPSTCSHVHDVNLVCTKWSSSIRNGKIRLTDGKISSEGYVEVYDGNGNWYKICGNFGLKEGNAACKRLGFTSIRASIYASIEGDFDMLVVNSSCEVNETEAFCLGSENSCYYTAKSTSEDCEPNGKAVYIKCVHNRRKANITDSQCTQAMDYVNNLRLYNGTDSNGTLQIYTDGEWGNVCGEQFSKTEGEIACRELGFSAMMEIKKVERTNADVILATYNISQCSGFENKLSECVWTQLDVSLTCTSGIVNLECSNRRAPFNSARLSGGVGPYGAIQRFNGRHWKGFCGTDNSAQTMEYYYKQMGYINSTMLSIGPRCPSDEKKLQDCLNNGTLQTCEIQTETVIYAQLNVSENIKEGNIMLSNGNYSAGVLQAFYNGSWVDVCTSMTTAHVACRHLGFYSVLGVYDDLAVIGLGEGKKQSDGPLAKYSCVGNEQSLNDCSFVVDENACQPPASSIIVCNSANGKVDGRLRLSDGGYNYGRLEIAVDGYWGTVCSEKFHKAAANVACKELGFNESLKITRNFGGGEFLPVLVHGTNCIGNESRLADCSNTTFDAPCDYTKNVAITCNVYCQPLTDISNGSTTCSQGDDGLPSYQDTCDIICNTGYALNGSTTRTCLGDRTWSGTDDECLKVDCQPLSDITNGSIFCYLGPANEDMCSVTCDTGYTLTGSDTRTCLSNRTWSGTDGTCNPVPCQPQPVVNNGVVTCSTGDDGISYYEDSCKVTCNTGYTLADGASATRRCLGNGSWSNMNGGCVRVKCPDIATVGGNANKSCNLGGDRVFSYGDTCNFRCDDGYTLTGSVTRTCQSDGSWSGTNSFCNRVRCPDLSVVDNGKIDCSMGEDNVLSYQDTCSVTCDTGFIMTGSNTRTCQASGSWSGIDTLCKRVRCQNISKLDNGKVDCALGDDGVYSYQDTCSVTCDTGYTLTGSDTRTCISNGSWSGMNSICNRVTCQNISKLDNGKVDCSLGDDGVHSYQDTCSVTCDTGYILTGNDTRTCLSNGSWSGMNGICNRVKCQNVSKLDNGKVDCSLGDDGVLSYQDTCSVTCDTGYTLTGSGSRTCLRYGHWGGRNGICNRVKCQNVPKLDNGKVDCSLGDDGVLSYQDTCNVTCDTGYTLTGSNTRTCLSSGSWNGMDSVCSKVQCRSISKLDNGNVSCSLGDDGVLSYQDTCNVTCDTGYTLNGSDTRICLSNGSWSGMDGICTEAPVPNPNAKSDDDNDSSNVGTAIGIVVGLLCLLAVIIAVIVVIYFVKRWYDKNRIAHQKFKDEVDSDEKYSAGGPALTLQTFDNPTYEMD